LYDSWGMHLHEGEIVQHVQIDPAAGYAICKGAPHYMGG